MTRLSTLFRKEIFESVSKSELDGIIFTFVWAFDEKEDWDFVDEVCHIFESKGADVYFVELEADMNERLERNKTEHRLNHKATKNNIEESENELKRTYQAHRLNSQKGEIKRSQYMRIDNTTLNAKEVAEMIKEEFGL